MREARIAGGGNPKEKADDEYMRSYSPYDKRRKRAYPAMLVEPSLTDGRVMYGEPAKSGAKLRTLTPV